MANFQQALQLTLINEGGFFHNKITGEVVNMGITLATLRSLGLRPGTATDPPTDADIAYVQSMTLNTIPPPTGVFGIYQTEYWAPLRLTLFTSQMIANKVFDLAVNTGVGTAASFLQQAINIVNWPTVITVDGKIGSVTIGDANALNEDSIMEQIRVVAARYYRRIVEQNPALAGDLNGWLARLAK